jgi:hypothetical protein
MIQEKQKQNPINKPKGKKISPFLIAKVAIGVAFIMLQLQSTYTLKVGGNNITTKKGGSKMNNKAMM